MAHVAEPLVGRRSELDVFDQALRDLEGGSVLVALAGEAGIGKTRLLAELALLADERDALVLSGAASELERDLPFWVFVDALDEYLRGLELNRLSYLEDDVRIELAAVLPAAARPATNAEGALPDERYRSYRAVRELLELLAAKKPLVLVLDDLHWADPASVELLGALLRRPPAAPVLIALALRPRQVPHRLSSVLARAERAGTLRRVDLGPLTRTEAGELLGEATAASDADWLFAESGGNPFYLEQLARATDRTLPVARSESSLLGAGVPSLVVAALSEELALLSENDRLVLEGAAVAGDPFEPELTASAAAITEAAVLESLDALSRLDLVRPTDVPRRFRFRHPLLRRAVYESTSSGWRLGAHERTAQALASRGSSAAARAHHVERSARQGDAAAVAVLREAGEAAAHNAPAIAARWFAGALRLVSDGAPTAERVDLLMAQARSLAATGQFDESRSALLECVGLVPDEAVALRVRLTTACAAVEHLLGHHEQAHRRLLNALDGLDDIGSAEAVALMLELSVDGYYRLEHESMCEWAERALTAARRLGDRMLIPAALAALAHASARSGARDEAAEHCGEAARLVDALPDHELALRLDAAVNLASAELNLGQLAAAAVHAERALSIARSTGQGDVVPVLFHCLGWVRRLRGELAESAELLDGAVESARLSGNVQSLVGTLLNRSLTAVAAGDLELALSTAIESVDLARRLDEGVAPAAAGLALATSLLATGEPNRAIESLVRSSGGAELPLIAIGHRANWLELLTRCWLAVGQLEDAEQSAARAGTAAQACGLRLSAAQAARAAAAVALASSDPIRAAALAIDSAEAADEVGARIDAAMSRTLAGRALAQAGQSEEAISQLMRAAAEFEECGALGYRAAAERELRQLGHHVHRRTRPGKVDGMGVSSLSGRELQIARMIVDLSTNPEIAAALFLSPKTVESHIRNIFRKLGVSSRVQIARAVELHDAESSDSRSRGAPTAR